MIRLRFLTIMALLLLIASPAHADGIDVKVKGDWDFAFGWNTNSTLRRNSDTNRNEDNFLARSRVRTQVNFITSEYLQGVVMFEIGNLNWGQGYGKSGPSSGADLDADGVNVETKRAYLDWVIPQTSVSVRMGIQGIALPMANDWSNPVFNDDVAGITVGYEFCDEAAMSLFWARPFDQGYRDSDNSRSDKMDMFGLSLAVAGEGWSVTPWGVYSRIGNAAGLFDYLQGNDESYSLGDDGKRHSNAWWVGVSTEVNLIDNLDFGIDAMYGRISPTDYGIYSDGVSQGRERIGSRGWFVAAALNYKLDWAVPGLFAWYGSGDSEDDFKNGQFGRMPVVGIDNGWAPTTFGFPGTYSIGTDSAVSMNGMGTWGIGAQIADVSFIEDLSHVLRFAYYRGTNDHEIVKRRGGEFASKYKIVGEAEYLTDKDYVLEVNFDHSYQIYENLSAILELGWIRLHLDDKTWDKVDTTNAWKAQVMFNYSF